MAFVPEGQADRSLARSAMVLRPGGTYDSSPAIYRRVRSYTGLRLGGTPEYRRSCVRAEGPPLLNSG